jgi:hypothetical protein
MARMAPESALYARAAFRRCLSELLELESDVDLFSTVDFRCPRAEPESMAYPSRLPRETDAEPISAS